MGNKNKYFILIYSDGVRVVLGRVVTLRNMVIIKYRNLGYDETRNKYMSNNPSN